MALKAEIFILGLVMFWQLSQSAPIDNHDPTSQDYQTRFKELHLGFLTEKLDWLLTFLEGTAKIMSKVYGLRSHLNSQDSVHSEYLVQMSRFTENMDKFEQLNRTASLRLLSEYIDDDGLAEDKKAALTEYFFAMEDALSDGATVLQYSKKHLKDLPHEFAFIGDEIETHFEKVYKHFDEFYDHMHTQLQLFASLLSEEEKEIHKDIVELCKAYRNTSTEGEKDLREKRMGMDRLFPLNLELEIKQAD